MAKLLIITQKVDRSDPILGFFHRWLGKFAEKFEQVVVICLYKGEFDLPSNVKVLSLGKENGASKLKYLFYFYKYIWRERKNYDSIFIHMNQIYVLLGWKFWKLWGKKIMLWRNHPRGSLLTNIAVFLSDVVFCTSKLSYTAKFKKTILMPAGIDTEIFKPQDDIKRIPHSILYVGRISPIKNVHVLVDALNILHSNNIDIKATIVGNPAETDTDYYNKIQVSSESLEKSGKLNYLGSVPNFKMPEIYNKHKILINLTPSGSLDKTILEAMACNTMPLVYNKDFRSEVRAEFVVEDLDSIHLAQKIKNLLNDTGEHNFRDLVVKKHSLIMLADKISQYAK